jgi:hypothetical protein
MARMMSRYVEVEVEDCLRTSDKAALLVIGGDEHWVPFSQIEDNGEALKEGYSGELHLTRWICDEKEIEYFDD